MVRQRTVNPWRKQLLVRVQSPQPKHGPLVYRLGHSLFMAVSGVRLSSGLPMNDVEEEQERKIIGVAPICWGADIGPGGLSVAHAFRRRMVIASAIVKKWLIPGRHRAI